MVLDSTVDDFDATHIIRRLGKAPEVQSVAKDSPESSNSASADAGFRIFGKDPSEFYH